MRLAESKFLKSVALALAMLIAVPPAALARFQPTSGPDSISIEQEIQLGRQAAQQTEQKEPMLPDNNEITVYVRHLGEQLTAVAPGYKWPYQFHVVNTKVVNAFALPGGPMFVNIGAIMEADHEDELAGVMAHEISHVVQRHATRAYTKQQKYSVGLGILGAILGGRGGLASLAELGAQFGLGSYFLKNSRQSESEADLLGTDIMYDAGYNPQGLADFFSKLEEQGGQGTPQFLSDHPNPGNREAAVQKELATLPPKRFKPDGPEFLHIKQLVGSMQHPGSGAPHAQQIQSGAAPSGIEPSGSFQTFQHNMYSVDYPSNWQIFGDPQSDVTIAPQGGIIQNSRGQSEVAYGVIISIFETEQRGNSSNSLDDGTHQLMDQLRQGNPEMRQSGSEENIRVNNAAGKSIDFTSKSPLQGQKERDWLVTVQRSDGNISYLVFIAPETSFGSLRPTFEQMLRSFHVK
ncbi:MAG: M48 family metalloprotease [Acidobacteriaceae bacterium]